MSETVTGWLCRLKNKLVFFREPWINGQWWEQRYYPSYIWRGMGNITTTKIYLKNYRNARGGPPPMPKPGEKIYVEIEL